MGDYLEVTGKHEEGEEMETNTFEIPFTVNIIIPDSIHGLMFDCVNDGKSFRIRKVLLEDYSAFMDSDGEREDEDKDKVEMLKGGIAMEPYRGPVFEDLEPELQDEFYNYLEDRG